MAVDQTYHGKGTYSESYNATNPGFVTVAVLQGTAYSHEDDTARAVWFRDALQADPKATAPDLLAQCVTVREGASRTDFEIGRPDES